MQHGRAYTCGCVCGRHAVVRRWCTVCWSSGPRELISSFHVARLSDVQQLCFLMLSLIISCRNTVANRRHDVVLVPAQVFTDLPSFSVSNIVGLQPANADLGARGTHFASLSCITSLIAGFHTTHVLQRRRFLAVRTLARILHCRVLGGQQHLHEPVPRRTHLWL